MPKSPTAQTLRSGEEPIADDEVIYRRVPVASNLYDPSTGRLDEQAFAPHKTQDIDGLSVVRAKYKSAEEAAQGRPGKSYYVAEFPASDAMQAGISIVPDPDTPNGYDPAHATMPDLNAGNRKTVITLERQRILAGLVRSVHGPFKTP